MARGGRSRLRQLKHDGPLLAEAAVMMYGIRLGLWLIAFPQLYPLLARLAHCLGQCHWPYQPAAARVGRIVDFISSFVPHATCLTKALTAWIMLRQFGHPAQILLGVSHDANGQFEAHAWVESHNAVIIGGTHESLARYTRLTPLE